jgi:hypothetical protein
MFISGARSRKLLVRSNLGVVDLGIIISRVSGRCPVGLAKWRPVRRFQSGSCCIGAPLFPLVPNYLSEVRSFCRLFNLSFVWARFPSLFEIWCAHTSDMVDLRADFACWLPPILTECKCSEESVWIVPDYEHSYGFMPDRIESHCIPVSLLETWVSCYILNHPARSLQAQHITLAKFVQILHPTLTEFKC